MNEARLRDVLLRQFDTAWALAAYHLDGLTTEECLWRPAATGPHVRRDAEGVWRADWPEHEGYDLGPPSIAWISWHMDYWWSTALDRALGAGVLAREDVVWPGDADGVRARLERHHRDWRVALEGMDDEALASMERVRWPFTARPFADLAGWLTVELAKNAAEIGYARFLYAARESST